MLAFRRQHHQEIATLLTDQDATQRRITELYTKAVEQLGSDKAPVRLGGLYALERLAQDNPSQRQTIVNVICAYLRMPFPATANGTTPGLPDGNPANANAENTTARGLTDSTWQQERQVRLTAQRILSDHLCRTDIGQYLDTTAPSRLWHDMRLDLTGATLFDFHLSSCIVSEGIFGGTTFIGDAGFYDATFTGGARFTGATFTRDAGFRGATFTRDSEFYVATFTGIAGFAGAAFTRDAEFGGATFTRDAKFGDVTFTRDANFAKATFTRYAYFGGAIFTRDSQFGEATFTSGTWFHGATFTGAAHFGEASFKSGPAAINFDNALVTSPDLGHVWPDGWQIHRDRSGQATITRP